MRTMTTHLTKVFDVFLNHTGYGIPLNETHALQTILTSMDSGHVIHGKFGRFAVCRTKVWEPSADAHIHGFRLAPLEDNPELAKAIAVANKKLEEFDTQQPESLWAEKPFWANL